MNPSTKDGKELLYVGYFSISLNIVILLIHLYYINYELIHSLKINVVTFDEILRIYHIAPYFDTYKIRLWILVINLPLFFFPTKGERQPTLLTHFIKLVIVSLLFVGIYYWNKLLFINSAFLQFTQIIISFTSLILIFRYTFSIAPYLSHNKTAKLDNDKRNEGFLQNEKLIENSYTTVLNHLYRYKGEERKGKVCFINPFRGKITLGTPGSGKTYVSLEEDMRQMIKKRFSTVIYDYKDPALSALAYSYLQEFGQGQRWGYISFKHLNKTYRANPMKGITRSEDANDYASVLMLALNKNMADKQGDFFIESSKAWITLNIYALGMIFNGKYQSLPHLLSFVGREITAIFPLLKILSIFYPDMRSSFTTFSEAFEQGALEQLQGQLASARIGLSGMNNPLLCYVMTEDEDHPNLNIDLDNINDKNNPMVFCIGNDPQKDIVLGLASSVYLSRLAKALNKKGAPTLFGIDELPTVFIKGLDNLIATARSNLIAVSLGFQDYAQLTRDYGDKIANTIIQTCGNIISGSVKGDTAKKLSESFGEKTVTKQSKSVAANGDISISWQEQKEKRIPQSVIEELSQGTFIGRMMDDFSTVIEEKVFYGKFIIDPEWKKIRYEIPIVRDLTEEELNIITLKEQRKVIDQVTNLINESTVVTNQYELLRKTTMLSLKPKSNNDENTILCLEEIIDWYIQTEQLEINPLIQWLGNAYELINNLSNIQLVNDIWSEEDKFTMLLEDLFKTTPIKIAKVHELRNQYQLNTIEELEIFNQNINKTAETAENEETENEETENNTSINDYDN